MDEPAANNSDMIDIIGISGSLRAGSFNTALLRAAAELVPVGARIQIGDISEIPLYDGDLEADAGIPSPVSRLKEQIASSRGLILVTPEYNQSIPGVLKNATDWLTRPTDDIPRVFHGRPVAVMGATPGGLGTVTAQKAWLPVLQALRTRPFFGGGSLLVSGASRLFDDQGRLTDDETRERLAVFLKAFVDFIG